LRERFLVGEFLGGESAIGILRYVVAYGGIANHAWEIDKLALLARDVCAHVPGVRFGKECHRASLGDYFGPGRLGLRFGIEELDPALPQPYQKVANPVAL
jgi:hypothetical protein